MHLQTDKIAVQKEYNDSDLIREKASNFGFAWLDSSMQIGDKGQNSFMMSEPIADIYLQNQQLHLDQFSDKYQINNFGSNIFNLIENLVNKYDLCAVGYISYESTLAQFGIKSNKSEKIPSIRFLLYENLNQFSSSIQIDSDTTRNNFEDAQIINQISRSDYIQKVLTIKDHIKEGDIYQANFTTPFEIDSPLTPYETYLRLRKLNPSPYAAFLNFGDYQILSSSPERMFTTDGTKISTCPIKGTIALGNSPDEQKQNLATLLDSHKDKAELLMIVDLMRNDIGKIAKTGTVKVESLFKPEIYSSLIHLVSDISATLKTDVTFKEIIDALLPGGSITGAPKKRAIEIINNLETTDRFVYTGSIGYITKEKKDFNIAIRTMYHQDNKYCIHAGGGIVADSNPDDEYNEMFLKAKNLLQAVGVQND